MKQRQFVQPTVASGASLSGENSALGAAPPVSSMIAEEIDLGKPILTPFPLR